jgi:LysR family glycine cleavage system transcriptional activator
MEANATEPKDPGLSWSQLRAFESCASVLSFGAAALRLNITASAVRYQIALLESRLGTRLFERQGGRVALTPAGASFQRRIERPMRELLRVCEDTSQTANAAVIVLTAPPMFAREFLFQDRFLKWCDANAIRLDVTDAKREFFGPDQIAAIRLGAEPHADLTLTPILKTKLVLAAAPSIVAGADPLNPSWWTMQNLLSPTVSELAWDRILRSLEIDPKVAKRRRSFSSYAAALEAACAGHGILLAALPFVRREFDAKRLARLTQITLSPSIGYSIVLTSELAATRRGRSLRQALLKQVRVER